MGFPKKGEAVADPYDPHPGSTPGRPILLFADVCFHGCLCHCKKI